MKLLLKSLYQGAKRLGENELVTIANVNLIEKLFELNFEKTIKLMNDVSLEALENKTFVKIINQATRLGKLEEALKVVEILLEENINKKSELVQSLDEKSYDIKEEKIESRVVNIIIDLVGKKKYIKKRKGQKLSRQDLASLMEVLAICKDRFQIVYFLFKYSMLFDEEQIQDELEKYLLKLDRKKFRKTSRTDKELNPFDERNVIDIEHIPSKKKETKKIKPETVPNNKYYAEVDDISISEVDLNEMSMQEAINYLLINKFYKKAYLYIESTNELENWNQEYWLALLESDELTKLIDLCMRAVEKNDEDANALYYLAEAYYRSNDYNRAYRYFKQVLNLKGNYRLTKERMKFLERNK
jgi:tetratricopeptide (TPR) repeat protein